jgi:hypothetical protein
MGTKKQTQTRKPEEKTAVRIKEKNPQLSG